MAFGGPLNEEDAHYLRRVLLCERFGWTLDYVDSLDPSEILRTVLILDAKDKAQAFMSKRGKK